MRQISRFVPLVAVALLLGGCRYKGWESFSSATGPENEALPNAPVTAQGDPYSFGSQAPATGGLKYQTNYGAGASLTATGPLNPALDQPEMGSGQESNQYSTEASPGHGEDNGPALQTQPGTMTEDAPLAHG